MTDKKQNLETNTVFCLNCQEITAIVADEGYRCADCGEQLCVECGCTESESCAGGCDWAEPGLCTECENERRK